MAIPTAKIQTLQTTDFTRAYGIGLDFVVGAAAGDDVDLTVRRNPDDTADIDMGPTVCVEFVEAGDYTVMDVFGNITTYTGVLANQSYTLRLLGIYKVGTTGGLVRVQW